VERGVELRGRDLVVKDQGRELRIEAVVELVVRCVRLRAGGKVKKCSETKEGVSILAGVTITASLHRAECLCQNDANLVFYP
jgi:hypothetical protein